MSQNMTEKAINTMSFEEALGELELLVRRLETGQSSLEETIKDYERGMALQRHCEAKLKEASLKIEKITKTEQGLSAEAFES